MDKLEQIFQMQEALNRDIEINHHLDQIGEDEWLQKLTLATVSELGELLDGTGFKWWKNKKELDQDYLREEIVDLFHFFVSMALRSGMDAQELFDRYRAKHRENLDRQHGRSAKRGYDPSEEGQA